MDPAARKMGLIGTRSRDNLQVQISEALNVATRGLLEGAEADLITFIDRITFDSIEAMALPPERRDAVLNEITTQVQVLGELHRLRAVNAGWDMVGKILTVTQKTAVAVLIAAV